MNGIIKIILHLFYWMVFCLFSGMVSFRLAYGFEFIAQNLAAFLFNLGWAAMQFYAFYFFFYRFIERQKYTVYIVWSVLFSVMLSFGLTLVFYRLFGRHTPLLAIDLLPQMAGTFIIGQTGSLLKGFVGWFDDIQHRQERMKMLLQTELDALNAQLNPHFLFNTLNNIDSLIRSNPDKASESLITLSEIMRYMLYDARKPMVPLSGEVAHYRNIARLQMLRMKDPSKVQFREAIGRDAEIAPLLFLPFVENAFKHAVLDDSDARIEFGLSSDGDKIEFTSRNPYLKNDRTMEGKTGGIGLANLKRRLELLYPGKYHLYIVEENAYFSVQLTLEP